MKIHPNTVQQNKLFNIILSIVKTDTFYEITSPILFNKDELIVIEDENGIHPRHNKLGVDFLFNQYKILDIVPILYKTGQLKFYIKIEPA